MPDLADLGILREALADRAPGMTLSIGRIEATRQTIIDVQFAGGGQAHVADDEIASAGEIAVARHLDRLVHELQRQAFDQLGLRERLERIEEDARRRIAETRKKVVEEIRAAVGFKLDREDQRLVAAALEAAEKGE